MYSNFAYNYYNMDISTHEKPTNFTNEIKDYFLSLRQNVKQKKIDYVNNENIKKDEQIIEQKNEEINEIKEIKKIKDNSFSFYNLNVLQISSLLLFSYVIYKFVL